MARQKTPGYQKTARNQIKKGKKVRRALSKRYRSDADYISSAFNLSGLIPSLKKFRKRKRLKKSEKATIRRRERQRLEIPWLIPVTKKQAKKLGRRKLFLPGFQAIQLRGVDPAKGDKIKVTNKGDIEVITKSQQGLESKWVYWPLDKQIVRSRRGMRDAGRKAFEKKFPIEIVSDLTAEAFKRYQVQEVRLWAHAGAVGDGFQSINSFIDWVNEKWNQGRYISERLNKRGDIYTSPSDPGKWVNGIAILIENPEYTQRRKELEREEKAQNKAIRKPRKRAKRI